MGHNVDLGEFGLCGLKCKRCGVELDISEVDIDCDTKSHRTNQFELSVQCSECQNDNDFRINLVVEK